MRTSKLIINKKGAIGIIVCAVFMTLLIASFHIISIKQSLLIENKNNVDFAINNAVSVNSVIPLNDIVAPVPPQAPSVNPGPTVKHDLDTWLTMFNEILKDNCGNTDINYMYVIKKEKGSFALYDLNNNSVPLAADSTKEQISSIISAFIKNNNSLDVITNFEEDVASNYCLIINKNIYKKINKDYIYCY